jgi:hypothetical protein
MIDKITKRRKDPPEGCCYGCERPLEDCPKPLSVRREFATMTGLDWPGLGCSLNVEQDLRTLGMDTTDLPGRASFCLGCSVAYMKDFNERLEQRRKRP